MPIQVLALIKNRSPGEWARIRPRVMTDLEGDETVCGLRDLAFVARVSREVVVAAIRGGDVGIPPLTAHRKAFHSNDEERFSWWCYLSDLVEWMRLYKGKSPTCTTTLQETTNDR